MDKFTYLWSDVPSTETDINTRLEKAWRAINWLSVIWKWDLTNRIKRSFFQESIMSILPYGCTAWTLTNHMEKKLDSSYTKMLRAVLNKSWWHPPQKTAAYIATYYPSWKLSKLDESGMQDTAGEIRMNS